MHLVGFSISALGFILQGTPFFFVFFNLQNIQEEKLKL